MAKEDLLAEAAELGVTFPGDEEPPSNRIIQAAIDEAKAASEVEESIEDFVDEIVAEEPVEAPAEEVAVERAEPVFQLEQFKTHAETVFGYGYHVLVGAQSAGTIPAGKVTKAQVAAGIEQYLNTPVEPKESE